MGKKKEINKSRFELTCCAVGMMSKKVVIGFSGARYFVLLKYLLMKYDVHSIIGNTKIGFTKK